MSASTKRVVRKIMRRNSISRSRRFIRRTRMGFLRTASGCRSSRPPTMIWDPTRLACTSYLAMERLAACVEWSLGGVFFFFSNLQCTWGLVERKPFPMIVSLPQNPVHHHSCACPVATATSYPRLVFSHNVLSSPKLIIPLVPPPSLSHLP